VQSLEEKEPWKLLGSGQDIGSIVETLWINRSFLHPYSFYCCSHTLYTESRADRESEHYGPSETLVISLVWPGLTRVCRSGISLIVRHSQH
jgi:hypothetical protein